MKPETKEKLYKIAAIAWTAVIVIAKVAILLAFLLVFLVKNVKT